MKLFLLSIPALLFPYLLSAQRYYPTSVHSKELIAISGGTTAFWGDIAGNAAVTGSTPQLGLSYEYKILPFLGLRASGLWYRLEASDAQSDIQYLRDRNLSFTSSNWELSLLTAAYLLPYDARSFSDRTRFNAYALAGFGLTRFSPKAEYKGEEWDLRSLETEGIRYSKTALVLPFGGGIQYKMAPQLDLALQLTFHYTFSDHLDDVSTRYRDQASFSSTTGAALADRRHEMGLEAEPAGAVRGNPEVKDSYSMISIRLQYHLMRYHYRGRDVKKYYQ